MFIILKSIIYTINLTISWFKVENFLLRRESLIERCKSLYKWFVFLTNRHWLKRMNQNFFSITLISEFLTKKKETNFQYFILNVWNDKFFLFRRKKKSLILTNLYSLPKFGCTWFNSYKRFITFWNIFRGANSV